MPKFETFLLPDAGEGLTEADIVTWRVAVGDRVEVNQPLVEIETAKSLVELPCPWDGEIKELLVAEGETVEVGVPIVIFDTDPDGEAPAEPAAPNAVAEENPSAAANLVDDATATEQVAPATAGENTAAVPAVATSSAVTTAAVAAEPASSGAVLVGYGISAGNVARRARKEGSIAPVGGIDTATPVLAKPPVRKLAAELGINLTTVTPSGPGGIVTREDVIQHSQQTQPRNLALYDGDDQPWLESGQVSVDGRSTRVPVKSVRKRTAEAMAHSAFTAPHVTVFHTVDVTATMDLVAQLKQNKEFSDVRVTPLLIVAKALVLAARRHPEINASWDEQAQEIIYKHYVNLGIAASTPRGLVVPNIKDAHRLTMKQLAVELQELTMAARSSKLTPTSMSDGTITITNVGVLGIDTGTPILNPGEAAILAFGAIRQMPWVHDGEVQPRWVTQLALSFDHRLVDGELGARVLADVAAVMNNPALGLVWA